MPRPYRRFKQRSPCPQCGLVVLNPLSSTHQRSVFHRHAQSVRDLLGSGQVSFAALGQRLGVTREYIRQVAGLLGFAKRRQAWSIERRATQALEQSPLLADVIREAKKRGLITKLIELRNYPGVPPHRLRAVEIEGFYCELRSLTLLYRDVFTLTFRSKLRPDFLLAKSPHGWMVIPGDKLPEHGTVTFVLGREKRSPGNRRPRHNWPSYLNAWNLLRRSHGKPRNIRGEILETGKTAKNP